MVADENKYWFEKDPETVSDNPEPASDNLSENGFANDNDGFADGDFANGGFANGGFADSGFGGNADNGANGFGNNANGENNANGAGNYDKSEDLFDFGSSGGFGNSESAYGNNAYGNNGNNGNGASRSVGGAPTENVPYNPYNASSSAPEGDPHANHYRSEYAGNFDESSNGNGTPTAASAGGSESGKAVRKPMLKKLLKYDYRALFRFLLPCYIALGVLAAVCAVCLPIAEHIMGNVNSAIENAFMSIFTTTITFYVIAVLGCSTACIIVIATRYQKNLFSAEGYLTLSIPATPEEQILSKLISGFTTVLLTTCVAVLSVFIVFIPYMDILIDGLQEVLKGIGQIFEASPGHATLFTVELFLLVTIGSISGLQVYYSCICIGQLFVNKNRTSSAAAAFVAYLAVSQVIGMFTGASGLLGVFTRTAGGLHALLWIFILFEAGISVGAFFWQRYVLKNKVNLA